jgi:hypothetical protein
MPGLAWLQLDRLAFTTKRAMADYEDYAAALARKGIQRVDQDTEKTGQNRCVFDVLYSASNKPNVEGFSVPELLSESSLLITTGMRILAKVCIGS